MFILDTGLSLLVAVPQLNPEAYGMMTHECEISHNITYELVPHSTVKKMWDWAGI